MYPPTPPSPLPVEYNLTQDASNYIDGYTKVVCQEMTLSDGQKVPIHKYLKGGYPEISEIVEYYFKDSGKHYFFVGLFANGKRIYGWVREQQESSIVFYDKTQGSFWENGYSSTMSEQPIPMANAVPVVLDICYGHITSAFRDYLNNISLNGGGYNSYNLPPDYYGNSTAGISRKRYDFNNNSQFDYVVESVFAVFKHRDPNAARDIYDVFYRMEGHKGETVTYMFDWTLVLGGGEFYEDSGIIRPQVTGYTQVP